METTAPQRARRSREEDLTTVVREKIERMILAGDLRAGERLNEHALAAELDVSRSPVREAARLLEHAGLVEIVRNRGVLVRKISLEDALHVYDVRAGLFGVAGRLLAARITPQQTETLEKAFEEMERARRASDQAAYNEGNHSLHTDLVAFAGNARLSTMHDDTEKELRLFVRRGVLGRNRLKVSSEEHRGMLDRVIDGDAEGAATAFTQHILNGKQRMLESLV